MKKNPSLVLILSLPILMLISVGLLYLSFEFHLLFLYCITFFSPFVVPSVITIASINIVEKRSKLISDAIFLAIIIPISCLVFYSILFIPNKAILSNNSYATFWQYFAISSILGEAMLVISLAWTHLKEKIYCQATSNSIKLTFVIFMTILMILIALTPHIFDVFTNDIEDLFPYLIIIFLIFVPIIISCVTGKFIVINFKSIVIPMTISELVIILTNLIVSISISYNTIITPVIICIVLSIIDSIFLIGSAKIAKKRISLPKSV